MSVLCRIQWSDDPSKVVPRAWSIGVVTPPRAGSSQPPSPLLVLTVRTCPPSFRLPRHSSIAAPECPARIARACSRILGAATPMTQLRYEPRHFHQHRFPRLRTANATATLGVLGVVAAVLPWVGWPKQVTVGVLVLTVLIGLGLVTAPPTRALKRGGIAPGARWHWGAAMLLGMSPAILLGLSFPVVSQKMGRQHGERHGPAGHRPERVSGGALAQSDHRYPRLPAPGRLHRPRPAGGPGALLLHLAGPVPVGAPAHGAGNPRRGRRDRLEPARPGRPHRPAPPARRLRPVTHRRRRRRTPPPVVSGLALLRRRARR